MQLRKAKANYLKKQKETILWKNIDKLSGRERETNETIQINIMEQIRFYNMFF